MFDWLFRKSPHGGLPYYNVLSETSMEEIDVISAIWKSRPKSTG